MAGQLLSRKPAVPKVCRNVEKGILFAFFFMTGRIWFGCVFDEFYFIVH